MIKNIFNMLILSILCLTAKAQDLNDFKSKLAQADSLSLSSVNVSEYSNVGQIIETINENKPKETQINVYRINIFFDNGQDARAKAQSTQDKFKELFPDIPSYLSYENPYFKITVGNCTTSQEAIIMQGKLKKDFPKSFLAREKVDISVMLE